MADLTLARVAAMGDFLTDEVWELQFTSLPKGFTGIDAEEINLRARSITIPDVPVNYLEVNHRTFTKSQPTHRVNYQQVSFSMIETMTPKTILFLRDWQNRCAMLGTNYVYPPSQRQCEAVVYHKRNDRTTALVYNLKYLQIETKGEIALNDGSGPAAIQPSITMNAMVIKTGTNIGNLA